MDSNATENQSKGHDQGVALAQRPIPMIILCVSPGWQCDSELIKGLWSERSFSSVTSPLTILLSVSWMTVWLRINRKGAVKVISWMTNRCLLMILSFVYWVIVWLRVDPRKVNRASLIYQQSYSWLYHGSWLVHHRLISSETDTRWSMLWSFSIPTQSHYEPNTVNQIDEYFKLSFSLNFYSLFL